MHLFQWPFRITMVLLLLALTACSAIATPTSAVPSGTRNPDSTRIPRPPTGTAAATAAPSTLTPTNAPLPTEPSTPAPTLAPTPTVDGTAAAIACNSGSFGGNITVFDGTKIGPGNPFQKSWLLRNTGECTWTPDYTLVFVNGARFGGDTAVSIPGSIEPGQYVTVSANLVAPTDAGTYTSYWMMKTGSGQFFGFGPKANEPVHVTILVMNLSVNNTPQP